MAILGITSVMPVAVPALTQLTDRLAIAKQHLKTGIAYFDNGEYEQALVEFQKAYDLSGRPNPMLNMGTCYKALGQPEKAITAYRFYLEKSPDAPNRREVETLIAELEKEISQKRETTAPIIPPIVTETPPAVRKDIYIPPSHETVAQTTPLTPALASAANPQAVPLKRDTFIPPPQETPLQLEVTRDKNDGRIPLTYRNLMWTSFGLSAAGLVTGVIGHLGARSKQVERAEEADRLARDDYLIGPKGSRDFRDQATADIYGPRLDELEASKNRYETAAITGFVSSAVFLGLTGTFYWLNQRQVRLSATPIANGGVATLEGGF